jgi:hypothetical protein
MSRTVLVIAELQMVLKDLEISYCDLIEAFAGICFTGIRKKYENA